MMLTVSKVKTSQVSVARNRLLKVLTGTSLRSKRFLASSSRKLGREQKKKGMETLATQAKLGQTRKVTLSRPRLPPWLVVEIT